MGILIMYPLSLLFLFCIHQLFDHPNYFNVLLSVTSFTFYLSSRISTLSLLLFLNVLNLCIIYPSKKQQRVKLSNKNPTKITSSGCVSLDAAQSSIYCRVFTKTVMVCAI